MDPRKNRQVLHRRTLAESRLKAAYLTLLLCGLVATGCGSGTSTGLDATQTTQPPLDSVWQLPEPHKYVVPPELSPVVDAQDAMLIYRIWLGEMTITPEGLAVVQGGSRGIYYTLQLSPGEVADIKARATDADFFNLSDRYWNDQSPNSFVDYSPVVVTYQEGGHSKTISTRGEDKVPAALSAFHDYLTDLENKVTDTGTRAGKDGLLVGLQLEGAGGRVWYMDIDPDGGVYYTRDSLVPAAHLSPEDLGVLKSDLGQMGTLSSDELIMPTSDVRDDLGTNLPQAEVTLYDGGWTGHTITVMSGASPEESLQTLLGKLVEIYDKYAPAQP